MGSVSENIVRSAKYDVLAIYSIEKSGRWLFILEGGLLSAVASEGEEVIDHFPRFIVHFPELIDHLAKDIDHFPTYIDHFPSFIVIL